MTNIAVVDCESDKEGDKSSEKGKCSGKSDVRLKAERSSKDQCCHE